MFLDPIGTIGSCVPLDFFMCLATDITFGFDLGVGLLLVPEVVQAHLLAVGAPVAQIKGGDWGFLQRHRDLPDWSLPFGHLGSLHDLGV